VVGGVFIFDPTQKFARSVGDFEDAFLAVIG
jgi:hypothetical protein